MSGVEALAPLLLVLPMAGFLITALIGRRLGKQAHWIPVLAIFVVWVVAMGLVVSVLSGSAPLIPGTEDIHGYEIHLFSWIPAGEFHIEAAMYIDPLTARPMRTAMMTEAMAAAPACVWKTSRLGASLVWVSMIANRIRTLMAPM